MQEMKPIGLILLTLHFYTAYILVRHAVINGRTVLYTGISAGFVHKNFKFWYNL